MFRFNGEKSHPNRYHRQIVKSKLTITRPQTALLISPITRLISFSHDPLILALGPTEFYKSSFSICRTERSGMPNLFCGRRPVVFWGLESMLFATITKFCGRSARLMSTTEPYASNPATKFLTAPAVNTSSRSKIVWTVSATHSPCL